MVFPLTVGEELAQLLQFVGVPLGCLYTNAGYVGDRDNGNQKTSVFGR